MGDAPNRVLCGCVLTDVRPLPPCERVDTHTRGDGGEEEEDGLFKASDE